MATVSVARVLGFGSAATNLVEATRKGLPAKTAARLAHMGDLTPEQLAGALGISTRTLARQRDRARLGPVESDRAIRLARVLGYAQEVFEGRDGAVAWLHDPIVALGGKAPVEFLDTDTGLRRVEQILVALDYGSIS